MFEFRFYSVASGRMASELALVHDMAIAGAPDVEGGPPVHAETLWERYGVPKPVGSWTTVAGSDMPGFLYIMKWPSMAERDARFPKFWADPFWRARRSQLTDGMPLVDSIENWILNPLSCWTTLRDTGSETEVGGLHELRVQDILNGSQAEAADTLATVDLPIARDHGARLLGLFEVTLGPARPRFVTLLAWPDADAQFDAARSIDSHPEILAARARERDRHGRRLFARTRHHLLDPVSWNAPAPNLGEPG